MRRAAVIIVAAFALAGGAAYAAGRPPGALPVALPSPLDGLTSIPPLTVAMTTFPSSFVGRISASARVDAKLDRRGTPFAVEATQRLELRGKGDYLLLVPAPLRDVFPARGTESDPGGRSDAVLWQGFSPGRRVLAARLVLEPRPAAAGLPLRVRIEERPGVVVVELRNATGISVRSFTGNPYPRDARRYLAGLRRYATSGGQPPNPYIAVAGVRPRTRRTFAPLRVAGELRVSGTAVPFALTLSGTPARIRVEVTGSGRPALSLRAAPLYPRLPTGTGLEGPALLDAAVASALAVTRARQYDEFIVNPALTGASRTAYVFRTAERPRIAVTAPADDGSASPLVPVLALLAAALGLGAAVVLWAHL
ncbi:MAG: hypothetical protein M3540_04845 [Actinomycetota bacterium]|nr:hypothetical protein [Actinomycetota bacterium]